MRPATAVVTLLLTLALFGAGGLAALALGAPWASNTSSATAAATVACSVKASCGAGEVAVFRMSSTANAHAGMPGGSSYGSVVCCGGVAGLTSSCSGAYDTVLTLSAADNAHAASDGSYATPACLSVGAEGTVDCRYGSSCDAGYACLATISGSTNAHVADCDGTNDYATKVCCLAAPDNCPTVANPAQTNTDGHDKGDACDIDDDDDGFSDTDEQAMGSDPLVKVRTPEVCDGDDDDGDTLVDEGFPDHDNDGTKNCVETSDPGFDDDDGDASKNGVDTNDDNSPNADPFSDALENYLGTNRGVMCAAGSNDNDPFDNDLSTAADVSDVLAYVAKDSLNTATIFDDDDYWRRGDLTNDGAVDVSDVLTYVGYGVLNLWCPYGL